jgi:hypothetical protein
MRIMQGMCGDPRVAQGYLGFLNKALIACVVLEASEEHGAGEVNL